MVRKIEIGELEGISIGKIAFIVYNYILFGLSILMLIFLCIVWSVLEKNVLELTILIVGPIILYFIGFKKIFTYIHEKGHQIIAKQYGYDSEIITDKENLIDIFTNKMDSKDKKRESYKSINKRIPNGFCMFEERTDYNPKHLQKIYLNPLKVLSLIWLLFILIAILAFLHGSVTTSVICVMIATLVSCHLSGSTDDVKCRSDIARKKENINKIIYENHTFYMYVKEEEHL